MLTQFRIRYPHGSLISELVEIDHGKYIVRALVQIEGVTIATGLAAADTIEQAEDNARNRALAIVDLNSANLTEAQQQISSTSDTEISLVASKTSTQNVVSKIPETNSTSKVSIPKTFSSKIPPATSETASEQYQPQPLLDERITANETELFAQENIESTQSQPPQPEKVINNITQFSPPEEKLTEESTGLARQKTEPKDISSEPSSPENQSTESITTLIDFSDIIAKTNIEIKRLGWTNEQGRNYLLQTYGKRTRQLLNDQELLEFWRYLESQPTPQTQS